MANKQQRDEKRRAARLRTNAAHRREEEEVLEKELELDIPDEIVEKEYEMMPMPTSWEEHEAMEMEREKIEHVEKVAWTARDLVSNILYANMSPEEKSKAIKSVGDGVGKKLKEVEGHEMKKELNLDLLEIQALLAKDFRHMPPLEKVSNWLSKFKVSDGLSDKNQVRNALSRAVAVMENGEEVENLPELREAAKKFRIGSENDSIVIEKDKTGGWRAILWPTNNFKDLDREIISESAHLEYVDWVNKNMECSPVFVTWHIPGTARENQTDFAGYESGHLIMSCALTEKEASELLKAQTLTDIGLSHGSIVLERDEKDSNIVTKYRMVEVSDLPLENAANPFTSLQTVIMKEADMDVKKYLVGMLGEEKAEEYLAKMSDTQKLLKEAGVESKEKAQEDAPTPAPDIEAIAAQVFERVTKELDVDGLNTYLSNLQESSAKVPVLEALVKELAKSRDDDLAEMIAPPAAKTLVWQKARASQSDETVLDEKKEEDKKLKKAKPELGWLSEATGTQPVEV